MNWRNHMPQAVITVEQEWARALARFVANQLPQAVSQVSDIQLNADQIDVLRRAFENTLVTNRSPLHDVPSQPVKLAIRKVPAGSPTHSAFRRTAGSL
jgi:hypothetical protein